jgi:Zn-dependent protease
MSNEFSQPPVPLDYEPIHPESFWDRIKRWLAPIGAGALALAAKLKALLLILPKIKILSTSGTMLVSIAAYALIWSWKFAIGFVLLLLIHEMGHVIQLRREGIKASAPMFIPFLGAVVMANSMGKDAAAEARVGLAGPVLGTIGTLIPLAIWQATGGEFWQALAYIGFFINLFNLLPVVPLDGGRAMAALSPWMWLIGLAALIALTFAFPNPILIIILLFAAYESYKRWQNRNSPASQKFHAIPPRTRAIVAVVYLGLVALLALGVYETHLVKTFADV